MPVDSISELTLRVSASDLDVIALVAPAGFGKTHVAAELVTASGRGAFCSLREANSLGAAARCVLEALMDEDPNRRVALSESMVASGEGQLPQSAESLWVETLPTPSVFVFDDVEYVGDAERDFIASLIARRPSGRRIVLCSRVELPSGILHRVRPHRLEIIRAEQLRMDADGLRRLSPKLGKAAASEIVEISAGWPIAALLFSRLYERERLRDALERQGSYEHLMTYLLSEYVQTLSPSEQSILRTAWAIPSLTGGDLAILADTSVTRVERFLRSSPFVSIASGRISVHALLAAAFATEDDHVRREILERAIQRFVAASMPVRAAECAQKLSDDARVADILQGLQEQDVARDPATISSIVSTLDRDAVLARPALYLATLNLRRFALSSVEAIAEAGQVYYAAKVRSDAEVEIAAAIAYVRAMVPEGRIRESLLILDELMNRYQDPRLTWRLSIQRANLLALTGRTTEARTTFSEIAPYVDSVELAHALSNIMSTIAARSGKYDEGIAYLEEAARLQRAFGAAAALTVTLVNIAMEAFFAGDDDRFRTAISEARANLMPGFERTWSFLLASATGHGDVVPSGWESASLLSVAYLFQSALTDGQKAGEAALRAYEEAKRYGVVMARVVTTIACAERVPHRRPELLPELSLLSAETDIEPFRDAIRRYVDGTPPFGVLDRFVQRFRTREQRNMVAIDIVAGRISLNGVSCSLSLREKAIMVYLAAGRRQRSRDSICDALWPDLDADKAANNLKVTVHRIRKKLGDRVLASIEDGYCTGADVLVDLDSDEQLVRALRNAESVKSDELISLERIVERSTHRTDELMRWDWYVALDRRIYALVRDATLIVARSRLASGRVEDALQFSQTLLRDDSLDEAACELVMKCHMARGDHTAARAIKREYESVLAASGIKTS